MSPCGLVPCQLGSTLKSGTVGRLRFHSVYMHITLSCSRPENAFYLPLLHNDVMQN